jgi:phosphate transport system permease protein
MVRGLIMIIMALDHTRDFFHATAWTDDPLNLATTTPALFLTRWITHFCAPVFVFLSGTSIWFQALRKSKKELSLFLIKRGLWLIFIEITIINFAFQFDPDFPLIALQVIWAIGIGMITAGLILSIMVIPFITAVMRDVFEIVPPMLKESAYGVGATTWEVVWKVVLPYTKGGVVGGIMLGLGRALGETMAVTFVVGNSNIFQGASLFNPGNTVTSLLANEFAEAEQGLHVAALMELGLILFVITFFVLAAAKLMLMRMEAGEGKKT